MRRPKYTADEKSFLKERERVADVLVKEQVKAQKRIDQEKPLYKQPLTFTIEEAQDKMDKVAKKAGYRKHSLVAYDKTHYYFKLYERIVL